jgi:hypothetical protein
MLAIGYESYYALAASTIHTGPRANVIGWPDVVVNVVPPSGAGLRRLLGGRGHHRMDRR